MHLRVNGMREKSTASDMVSESNLQDKLKRKNGFAIIGSSEITTTTLFLNLADSVSKVHDGDNAAIGRVRGIGDISASGGPNLRGSITISATGLSSLDRPE